MADFDLTQTGQEVQNILDGAAMQTDLTAENERAEQAEQTLQGNIDAEETRAKAAEKQNADDIDLIEAKIPAGASDQNQLADKEFVNNSIATATATFRGAYNLVNDLGLTVGATHEQIATALAGAISTADNNDYCFVQIPTADATPTQIASIERYKFNGTAWAYEYTLNNSGFTAAQWAALNSGITSGLVAKLLALPTNDALTLALAGKQDVLTFDSVPVDGSNNPVKSGGVYSAIGDEETRAKAAEKANADDIDDIEALIPATASDENQLADKQYVNDGIATASATYRGSFNEVNDLSLTTDATHEQIATALAGAISTADNNDYCFVQIPTSDAAPTQIASIERYKFNGTAWSYEYTLNNSGFTAAQWAALNSGITSGLVAKLSALPTNDALTLALAGKQDVLTFDNEPTNGSNNPVKSGGVYDAIDVEATTRAAAIAAIVALIPEAASALNQLADKAFVNSSISTATAVFKGTYNVVVDLELSYNATQEQIAAMLASKIISADNNDYCFVQIPTSDAAPLQIARTDRYKFNGTAWAYEYTLNNSGFTAAQWAAINSGITSLLKDKLIDLPTATELTSLLAAKQNQLTFDTTPTTGSTNPVTSGGIKSAIDAEKTRAEAAEADRYTKSETYNKTEINGMVSTPHQNYVTVPTYASLPSSGQSTDTIYRVSSYDGANNQVDNTVYSEYAWDGTQYVFLRVNSQIEEVFDITVYNNNTKYADLSAALGVDGANIPATLRRGGMSVKFVQSSDNKYVQYRLMATSWSTNEADWADYVSINTSGKFIGILARAGSVIPTGTIIFTKDDVQVGDVIALDVTSSDNSASLAFLDSENNALYVKTTGSGEYTITSEFNICKIIYGSSGTSTINRLENITISNRGLSSRTQTNKSSIESIANDINRKDIFFKANIGLDVIETNRAYVRGDIILTSEDVQEGDVLMVSMVVTGSVGLGMFVTGQTSPDYASNITRAFTYVIPSGFSNCRVYYGDGSIQFNYFKVKGIANRTIVATQNADRQDVFSVKSAIGLNFVDTTKAYKKNDVVFTKNDARAGDVLHMVLNYNDSSTTLVLYSDTNTVLVSYAKPSNADSRTVNYTIPSNFDRAVVLWGSGTIILSECYIKNIKNRELKSSINDRTGIYVAPSEGLDGIKSAFIKLAQTGSKGKIILGIGVYSGTSAVSFYEYISSSVGTVYTNGIIIEGQGYGTVLNRTTGASEIQLNDSISDNILVKNLRVMHGIAANNSTSNNRNISFKEVWINEAYYDEYKIVGANIVNIGADYYYKKFTAFQAAAAAYTAMPLEIHLYGHIKETSEIQQIQNTDTVFIGHNAILELDSPMARAISINTKNCKFKDIHFIKSGCGNYWDLAAVNVYSYDTIFENCIFENKSFSPTPFNQADFIVSAEDYRGSRRYGIEVASSGYGKENKLVFINCKGIGSPYGFQNTRGFYILFGEPKLYNCIGIGGGIGEFGHGILSHRSSRPTMFNCIGYAGPMSYRKAAGIRVQCAGSPLLESCVGYGGCNKQYKSNGVSYATLHEKCVELGISDESFFYDGSNVNYDGLTLTSPDDGFNDTRISLLSSLSIEDLDIVELESNSEENYGIGLWAGQNKPRLMNCVGYSGGGVGSIGLLMESQNEPTIVGGYFGVEDMTDLRYFVNDQNNSYMTFLPTRLNEFTPYTVTGLTLLAGNYDYRPNDYIRLETVEATPRVVAEGQIRGLNINIVPTTKTDIPAGTKLKMYVVNNGNVVSIADNSIRFQLFYNYNNLNSYALKVGSSAAPVINGAIFESADASDCVVNDSTKEDTLIHNCTIISRGNGKAITTSDVTNVLRMFNNAVKGSVDSNIQFATQQSVNGSSNYNVD